MHGNHAARFNLVSRGARGHDRARISARFSRRNRHANSLQFEAHARAPATDGIQDLRNLLWSSIDNDTSKDLDQIEWAEQLPDGRIRVLVGVADVDARVHKGTVIDNHAQCETTSVYTGVKVFPMLPAELSEGITSLNENEDRAAIVIEFCVDAAGAASATARPIARWCATARNWPTTAWAHGLKATRPAPAEGGRQRRSGRAAQAAGQGRAAHGGQPLSAWRARSGNHRDAARAC